MAKIAPSGLAVTVLVTSVRRKGRRFGGRGCIVGLGRGHIDRDRHREHRSRRCTSLLRHFLLFPVAQGLLSSGVPAGSRTGTLIPGTGTPVRGPAGHGSTRAGAINIAVIAPTADADQHAAAPAAVQPVALLPLLHPTPPQHWTAPGCTGLNALRRSPPQASHRWRPGGFDRFPGLLLRGRRQAA
jgi:hypothetical protein